MRRCNRAREEVPYTTPWGANRGNLWSGSDLNVNYASETQGDKRQVPKKK